MTRHMSKGNEERKRISIVVPVYNEREVVDIFYQRLKNVLDSLQSFIHEIIFVDDGSKDGTYQKLINLASSDKNINVMKLTRNFGHQIAITAGIDFAKGDAVVVIDADLQDPPEIIKDFVIKWQEGYDVVYGVREKRPGETGMKIFTANLFYRILKRLTHVDIPIDVGDFRLMSKRVVKQFRKFREQDRFVRGLVSWVGYNQIGIPYSREKRYAGETKYPYAKMLKFAIDGLTSFSSVPLRLATYLGYITSFFAFLYACSVFIQKALGITVQGWATIMVGMLFIGGVQLICLGIIGEYISRIFTETKQRPMYLVEEVFNSESYDSE